MTARPVRPRPAASLVLTDADNRILMGRRPSKSRFAPDAWVFPGGRVDPIDTRSGGDRFRQAAVRETHEETGLTIPIDSLTLLGRAITPSDSPIRFDARFFIARPATGTDANLVTNGEFVELDWLALDRARGLPLMDVTELMLDEAIARLDGEERRPLLLTYRRGIARITRP